MTVDAARHRLKALTSRPVHKADFDANLDRAPCKLLLRPAPARLLKAMKAILVPGLGLPPRADGAKATKRSHLSDMVTCTGPGSRGRLRPERRLVLGFSWSLNCGGFAWALTKAAHAPEGHISCASSRPSTADQKVSPRVPQPPSQSRCGHSVQGRGRARRANAALPLL